MTEGLSQADLSKLTGIAQSTISKLETEITTGIDFATLEKLAKALSCDPGYLIVNKD